MSYSEGLFLSSIKVLKHSLLFVRLDLNKVSSIVDFNMPEFNMKKKILFYAWKTCKSKL